VVVGPAGTAEPGAWPAGARGSFRGFGVPLDVALPVPEDDGPGTGGPPAPDERHGALPEQLAVAAWLLGHADWAGPAPTALAVADDLHPDACLRAGRDIAGSAARVALLVMGDGSACRTLKAPGYLDERAAGFDASLAAALAAADTAALACLDVPLARALLVAGRAPLQVLAGAAEGAGLTGRLLYEEAPYGVGYFVAAWS
jgi:hypothetical protein